ncbi:MAG: TonB family protein, partial [Saprospiraceae bacterium]|nr:TonB family protein [Saprospiraceae bacterium]
MKKEVKPKHFIHKPEYPGGIKAMRRFLAEQQQYPAEALAQRIEGTVQLRYTIDHSGTVIRTKVISGVG